MNVYKYAQCEDPVKSPMFIGSLEDVAMAVIRGEYGTGAARRAKLTEEGWNFALVQAKVSEMMARKL